MLGLFYNWKLLKYNFSHEEIWLPDKEYNRIHNTFGDGFVAEKTGGSANFNFCGYIGECFSSTTRGAADGVRFAPASEVLKHPERWSYIEFEVDPERLEVALEESKKIVGLKYDFWGVFGFIQPFAFQDPKKYFCSELCDWFKVLCGIHPKRQKRVSPRRSAYLLSKKWGNPVPLV